MAGKNDEIGRGGAGFAQPFQHADTSSINRVKTGISGFDEMIEGGIPENSTVMLSGSCGTGKTTFGMQFIYEGALAGEAGVYVTLEDDPKMLVRSMSLFGWKVQELIDGGKLTVVKPELYEIDALINFISRTVENAGAKRLVVDSFTLISTYLESPYEIRKAMMKLSRAVKKLGCTTLALSDVKEKSEIFSITGFEEFIVDGVIVLSLLTNPPSTNFVRAVFVRKMRMTNHLLKYAPFVLGPEGIVVYSEAEIFGV